MSAKNSFDLTRKVPIKTEKSAPRKTKARPPASRPRKSLRRRREAAQTRVNGFIVIIIALIVGALIYGLWRPEVRISAIETQNVASEVAVQSVALQAIAGTYFAVLPRDSIFFYPKEKLREAVLSAYPSLSAVSISRESFTSVRIEGNRRVAAFYWCGESAESFSLSGASCFEADTAGLLFAPYQGVVTDAGSSTPLLRIYAPISQGTVATYPVGSVVEGAVQLPNLLRFVKAVKTLGIPVLSTSIQGDEAELFVTPRTRIKYVLGREEEAATNAQAAFPNLNLLNDTIEYIDLRFDGKVYVKRYGE